MSKFNCQEHHESTTFVCNHCGKTHCYKEAMKGCLCCGNHLFKLALRFRGTPTAWDPDAEDPYVRQTRKPVDTGSGSGNRLTIPGDENFSGGFGSRFRGKDSPSGYSQNDPDYSEQRDKDIPGSYDTLLENPPIKEDVHGEFADPQDTLSKAQEMNRQMNDDQAAPINERLNKSRQNNTLMRRLDDSVYKAVNTRLRR